MTIEELLEASRKKLVTEEDVRKFEIRIKECEYLFDKELRQQSANKKFMERSYSL